jgi:hypothetical protein
MLPTPEFVSNFVENQFPSFYREEGENFVAFVKAYYEWMEETGGQAHKTRNLFSTRDIDLTADEFVENFKKKYLFGVPKEIAGDKRFLQKHILDLYRSKGSYEGLKLLFRLLYNEDIQIYIPSVDILKTSDGTWVEKQYIEITYTPSNRLYNNELITGVVSGATAFVENYQKLYTDGAIIDIFYVSNIQGTFSVNEKLIIDGVEAIDAPTVLGSPIEVTIDYTQPDNTLGDILVPSSGNGSGQNLKLLITDLKNAGSSNGTIFFTVQDGGRGYTNAPTITITGGSNSTGSGATVTGVTLKDKENFQYSLSYINYAPYYPKTETFNGATSVANTTDFITVANNAFANNDRVLYTTDAGNTVVTGLTNNTSYWVVSANGSGLKLSTTRGGANINLTSLSTASDRSGHNLYKDQVVRFNANTDVANTTDFISITNNLFANGDQVQYLVEAGNTAISGLVNSTVYYVSSANSLGLKLSTAYATAQVNITAGLSEYGHTLAAINVASYTIASYSYGSALLNANVNTVIDNALAYQTVEIGTIDKLTGINPGNGYDGYINISIVDPLISGFGIPDGYKGGIKGTDAVITANVQIGTGLVNTIKVKNSGYGYNTDNEEIQIYNSTQSNTSKISKGYISLGAVGTQEGFWTTTKGFLDSNKYIQDSYYYQEYSYEIKSSKSLDKYLSILKDVFHPVGNQPFGKALIFTEDTTQAPEIINNLTIYRVLGAALAPAPAGTDAFRLNVSRLT